MSELTEERKAEIDAESRRKLSFLEREYWRVRNGKARFMRCPYCMRTLNDKPIYRRNFVNGKTICCALFGKAFEAILDRQEQIDIAAQHARNILKLGELSQNEMIH